MIRGKLTYIFIVIISLLISSGCVNQQQTGTPMPTAIPTPTTPAVQPGTSVEILNAPATAIPGESFDIIWGVNSLTEKTISYTAIHYGSQSRVEPLTLTSYPNLTPVMNGTIPANFSTSVIINETGIKYFRAHAIIDGVNYWSTEKIITVYSPATITVTSIPNRVVESTNFAIKWKVEGGTNGEISKTDLIWDLKKGNMNVTDYSNYTPSMTGKTPQEFNQTMKAPKSSTIFFRAHAIVDGIEILSDEKQITIYPEYTSGY